ncbi:MULTISPECIES: NAD-dependent epimerase/dehydratase family protein [unclassified Kosakonia]|uniref:NAD-dependent epimerase/dehydratase family protein n=1 Tax=unclassified Kosakonia TaxID=2632876 RepID=UPI0031B6A2A8
MGSKQSGVLITGGAGFIGKALIAALLEKKIPVISFDISEKPSSLPDLNENFNWYKFSYLDSSTKREELQDIILAHRIKTVIHLATTMFPMESKKHIEKDCFENVYSNVVFFKSLYENGCEQIIFSSSGGTVYGKADHPFSEDNAFSPDISYGLSKSVTETYLRFLAKEYGRKSISLRISNPYGEGQRLEGKQGVIPIFINKISKGIPIDIIGSLESKRDYIYISDLVSAFERALEYKGMENVFNIGSGVSTTLNELLHTIQEKLNKKAIIGINESVKVDSKGITLNIERAKRELKWCPKVTLNDGLERLIELSGCKKL